MTEKSLTDKFKEAGKHTLIYGMGSVLQNIIGFILIPLYTKYYTPDMYGTLALVSIVGTIGSSIFYFGVHSALARSYYDYHEGHERDKVISTTFYILLFGAILQIIIAIIVKDYVSYLLFNSSKYGNYILIVLISVSLNFIINLGYMILRFQRKSKFVMILNISKVILLTVLILFFLVILQLGILAPILGNLILNILIIVALFNVIKKHLVLNLSIHELKIQLKWGLGVVLGNFSVLTLNWVDRFFINKFCTLDNVGIYSMGYNLGMIITILLVVPFSQIWAPMRMEYRNDKNVNQFYGMAISYYFLIGLFICVAISIFAKDILTLMVSRKEYIAAYQVIPWVILSYLLVGSGNLMNYGIVFKRKVHKFFWIGWFSAGVNVLLNFILIPRFGYIAAAYTTLFSFSLGKIIDILINNHYYRIPFEKRLIPIIISSLFILFVGYNISLNNIMYSMVVKCFLMVILLTFWYIFVFTGKEREKIAFAFNRIF